jgi:sugar lactone lactonase YvrE
MRSFVSALLLALVGTACTHGSVPHSESAAGESAGAEPKHSVPALVASFDSSAGELPEGLLLTPGSAYVGFAPSSRIVKVDVETGEAKPFAELPAPIAGKGFMTGLAQSAAGDVYAGLASFVPEVQAGIYRVSAQGGKAELFAKDAALPFPNALAFDGSGNLFATDSGTGTVFRIDAQGHPERWATGDVLSGQKEACDNAGPGFAIGVNGLVVEKSAVYVVNLDKATLVRIPLAADGSAGEPKVLAGPDCATLGGADGLVRAPDGSFVVAVNRQNKLLRITEDGSVTTLAEGEPFDFPASVAYAGRDLFVTSFALKTASAGLPSKPALLRLSP